MSSPIPSRAAAATGMRRGSDRVRRLSELGPGPRQADGGNAGATSHHVRQQSAAGLHESGIDMTNLARYGVCVRGHAIVEGIHRMRAYLWHDGQLVGSTKGGGRRWGRGILFFSAYISLTCSVRLYTVQLCRTEKPWHKDKPNVYNAMPVRLIRLSTVICSRPLMTPVGTASII